MRDDKISVSAMTAHLKKMHVKCTCGADLGSGLRIDGDRSADICSLIFMHSSNDGLRNNEGGCGPFAVARCKRCGMVQFFFIPDVLNAIKSGGSNGEI